MATTTRQSPVHTDTIPLAGKVALVTGGTTGIGRATALLLAERGVKVVVYGRHEGPLRDTLADLERTGAEFHGLTADQAYEDQVARVFQETRQRFGDIDILVNNAAVGGGGILEMSYDDALYLVRTNLLGYLACVKQAVTMMRRKGGGHIVNVGSMSAEQRAEGADVYVATKAAVQAMSASLRRLLAKEGIRLSLVEPGSIGTSLGSDSPDLEQQRRQQAAGELLKAEDIAAAIVYVLTQPARANVLDLQVAPVKEGL